MNKKAKYGVFISRITLFDRFFSFDFAKKKQYNSYYNEVLYDNWDNCIIYSYNKLDFACENAYNFTGIYYKQIMHKLQLIQKLYKKDIEKLKKYCIKNGIELEVK